MNKQIQTLWIVATLLCLPAAAVAQVGDFEGSMAIGDVTSGSASETNGTYLISAQSGDIWGIADGFQFVYSEMTGAFTVKGLVILDPGLGDGELSKAGFMVRDSLEPGSPNGFAAIFGLNNDYRAQWRNQPDGPSGTELGFGDSGKVAIGFQDQIGEIELERFGDLLNFYYLNLEGERTLLTSHTVPGLEDPVYVGMAVASNGGDGESTGEFSDVELVQFPFAALRTVPDEPFEPGETVSGITVSIELEEGVTKDLTVTETIPEGWTLADSSASAGEVSVEGDAIVWTVPGASGSVTLTYDLQSPAGTIQSGILSGTVSDGELEGSIGGANKLQIKLNFVTQIVEEFDDGDIAANVNGLGSGWLDISQGGGFVTESDGQLHVDSIGGWSFARGLSLDPFLFWNEDGVDIEFVIAQTDIFDANQNQAFRGFLVGIVSTAILEGVDPNDPQADFSAVGIDPEHNAAGSIYTSFHDTTGNGLMNAWIAIDGTSVPEPDNAGTQGLSMVEFDTWDGSTPMTVSFHVDQNSASAVYGESHNDLLGAGTDVEIPAGTFSGEFANGGYIFVAFQDSDENALSSLESLTVTVLADTAVGSWELF